MRTRLFVITGLAFASVFGAASAAVAGPPQCCGDKIAPKPTTTTVPPKGPDKIAPKPTTTIPPKGPDDLAPKPPQGDDPKPKGPGDLVQPTDDGDGPVEPGPDTTGNGSGSDNYTPPANDSGDNGVDSSVEGETGVPAVQNGDAAADASAEHDSDGIPPFVLIFLAAVVGGLLAVVATRVRRDEEDVEQI